MRVLVASTAGGGHVGPLRPVIEALLRRGDELRIIGSPGLIVPGHDVRIGPAPSEDAVAAIWAAFADAGAQERGVLINRELFGRLQTTALVPFAVDECAAWRPQLVVREPCEYASAIAARRLGVPQVQVAISLGGIETASLALARPALERLEPGLVDALLATPYLTRFPASLDPPAFPDTRRYRIPGPTPGSERARATEPAADARPLIYVTFGTVLGTLPSAVATFRAAIAAVADQPVHALVSVGRDLDPQALGPLPANVRVEPWVAQDEVLATAALVVGHGGSGTTFGALAAGVPLVLVPLFADQPANARRVVAAGAGIEAPPEATAIRAAVTAVLADPAYRRAAQRLGAEMGALDPIDGVL